ncbi:hypothetical protein ABZS76_02895 [Streptomyces sp. NPDC005562]|uniref:hypothetical protein n=1 Tax=Streptomyces sp. NPDC005562 TaxID=3154890 RepID=UPI0033BADFCB
MRDDEKSGGLAEFGAGEVDPGVLGEVVVPEDPDDPTVIGEIPDRRVVIVAAVLVGICAAFIAYGFLGGGDGGGDDSDGDRGPSEERPARTASAPYRVPGADTGAGPHADRSP